MIKLVTVEIAVDGPRLLSKELPADWDSWTEDEQELFLDNMKMELIDSSVQWTVDGLDD